MDKRLQLALETAGRLPEPFQPSSIPGLFSDVMAPDTSERLAAVMSDAGPVATRVMALAFAEADLRHVLPASPFRPSCCTATPDERSPLPVVEALHAAIPGSHLVVLPGLGRECSLEAPDRFDGEVRRFLTSVG